MSQEKIDKLDAKIKQIQMEKRKINARKKAEDLKAKNQELHKVASLLIVAGLVDGKTGKSKMDEAELVGAMTKIAQLPEHHEKRMEWHRTGAELLNRK